MSVFCCVLQVEDDDDENGEDGDGDPIEELKPGKCKPSGLVPSPKACMLMSDH